MGKRAVMRGITGGVWGARKRHPLTLRLCDFGHLNFLVAGASICVSGGDYGKPRLETMKITINRLISIATLVASVIALVMMLGKPAPVARSQNPATISAQAQSFDQKMTEFEQAAQTAVHVTDESGTQSSAASKPEVRISSDEVSAVLAQSLGNGEVKPDASAPSGATGIAAPTIKDQQVGFEGDVVHGQFLMEIAGKDVWITISGHLGEKDGFATFDPTEFKVGDLNVPVSLVNAALQKKLAEQRDRLKLPENVTGLKIENGELVMQGR